MKEYKSSLDTIARFAPWFLILLAAVLFEKHFEASLTMVENLRVPLFYFGPGIIAVLYISMYLLRTTSIGIDSSTIVINRPVKPVTIDFSDIASIRKVENMKGAMRTFGNGGVFGYTGKYYKKDFGSMTWYCTQRKNYILIEKTNGKKLVITPDDVDGFMQDVASTHSSLITTSQVII